MASDKKTASYTDFTLSIMYTRSQSVFWCLWAILRVFIHVWINLCPDVSDMYYITPPFFPVIFSAFCPSVPALPSSSILLFFIALFLSPAAVCSDWCGSWFELIVVYWSLQGSWTFHPFSLHPLPLSLRALHSILWICKPLRAKITLSLNIIGRQT